MFIWNADETALINVRSIDTLYLSPPAYEQKYYIVVASVRNKGTSIIYRGTEESCKDYMNDFYYSWINIKEE